MTRSGKVVMRVPTSIISLIIAWTVSAIALADSVPLLNLDPAVDGTFVEPANNKTWGYSFYVTTPIVVTHLAWNDTGRDGLSHSHPVGIWRDTSGITQANWEGMPFPNAGTLITSATIPAGNTAELAGPWRRVPIAPVTLTVGGYAIGGQNNSQSTDDMVYRLLSGNNSVYDPRVLKGSFTFNTGGPDGFYSPGSLHEWYLNAGVELGPMMFIEAVPEPNYFALMSIGATILAYPRRRPIQIAI
jgi:hypothetical protein